MNYSYSLKLFKKLPEFIDGIKVVGELYGIDLYENINGSETEELADQNALTNDVTAVGQDINDSINTYGKQQSPN